ncbi:MAG: HD-GYP domain-containing protein [Halioglobus sp.]|nr:HD-GYP domain-containing protein [Halioglobus sp.]
MSTAELNCGMFVSGLDRPWLGTPFVTQGFFIEDQDDIERLRKYCEWVLVDTRRSRKAGIKRSRPTAATSREKRSERQRTERPRVPIEQIFHDRELTVYADDSEWEDEKPLALDAMSTLFTDIDEMFEDVGEGEKLNVVRLRKSVDPVVDSISRNPDACLWVSRMKQHDTYTYKHSLSASIWAVALGRQIGLARHDLRSLAMGAMLMDIGKLKVAPELLQADRELTPQETAEVAGHVSHGLDILTDAGMLNRDVLDMVAHHHERYDGSGYPDGLCSEEIPPFARIAAVVDTYDALTTKRSYAEALSPSDAIKMLYKARDTEFQAEFVEAFIQAVGIYPAGTLVELSSGEVGVVVAEYRTRRLRPKVMLLLDNNKRELRRSRVIDLQELDAQAGSAGLTIKRSLEPDAFGIDLSQVAI